MLIESVFNNKKVLITGHTGFKGSWLASWLNYLGADVSGIALPPPSSPSLFDEAGITNEILDIRLDVRNHEGLIKIVDELQPDFVFHLAAQSLVRKSYTDPIETWQTNVLGTLNLLDSLRKINEQCIAIIVTSDKCYDNVEWVWGYRENDRLGGPDPYSASKGAAELAFNSYVKSFFQSPDNGVLIASARAGNVIGGGDWAKDRVVPDCIRAWSAGETVELRNPKATRPWQHVLEPLSGYLLLACHLSKNQDIHGESYNFGPMDKDIKSVQQLVEEMSRHWDKVNWRDIPASSDGPYESNLLKLNCDKALMHLNWHAAMDFKETIRMTVEWYKEFYDADKKSQMKNITVAQIVEYTNLAKAQGLLWAM